MSVGLSSGTALGMYHVTINIRVTGLSGAIARAAISVDSCLPTGSTFCPNALYSDMQYLQDPLQPNTLLVSGVMALAAFRKLEVTLYCSAVCSIEKESVFSVIYMGESNLCLCDIKRCQGCSQPCEVVCYDNERGEEAL